MGLLLCSKEAEHPYYYDKLDVNLWSIQELCYVVCRYPVMIPEDFINRKLISWLRDELSLGILAAKLEQYMGADEEQEKMILLILKEGNYYTQQEIAKFQTELKKLRETDSASFQELVGDTFFRMGKYGKAVECYRESAMLHGPDNTRIKMKLADAFVTVMQYRKASDTYEEVFVETNQDEPLRKLYFIAKLEPSVSTISKYIDSVDTEKLAAWEMEYEAVLKKAETTERVERVNAIYQKDRQEFRQQAAELLKKWKKEYREKV